MKIFILLILVTLMTNCCYHYEYHCCENELKVSTSVDTFQVENSQNIEIQ